MTIFTTSPSAFVIISLRKFLINSNNNTSSSLQLTYAMDNGTSKNNNDKVLQSNYFEKFEG